MLVLYLIFKEILYLLILIDWKVLLHIILIL
jgi:hypothetical protein